MSSRKFKFVSPGVFTKEIDLSKVPALSEGIGPAIIGRSEKGPGLRPVEVQNYKEFIDTFGNPLAGLGSDDPWRDGHGYAAPTYAAYAAKAYLRNGGPVTFVRLMGDQNAQDSANSGMAGWRASSSGIGTDFVGGKYAMFVIESGSAVTDRMSGSLAAVFYCKTGCIALKGVKRAKLPTTEVSGTAMLINPIANDSFGGVWKALIHNEDSSVAQTVSFDFNPNSAKYIRKAFNTDPTKTNTSVATDALTYWLGETYATRLTDVISTTSASAGSLHAFIVGIQKSTAEGDDYRIGLTAASTGWIFSQDTTTPGTYYDPTAMQKLFKIHSLDMGGWDQRNIKISISNIKPSPNEDADKYGSFSVLVRRINDHDGKIQELERFSGLNLNPNSPNYIAKIIGDRNFSWDYNDRLFREYGKYSNNSRYIRVEINEDVDNGVTSPALLPFGFLGPRKPLTVTVFSGSTGSLVEGSVKHTGTGIAESNTVIIAQNDICQASPLINTAILPATLFLDTGRDDEDDHVAAATTALTASLIFPGIRNRENSDDVTLRSPKDAYFGFDTRKAQSSSPVFDEDTPDYLRISFLNQPTATERLQNYFTLDELCTGSEANLNRSIAKWTSGSRQSNAAAGSMTRNSSSYSATFDYGYNKFTVPMFGGHDGVNITEREPFGNHVLTAASTEINSYAFNAVRRAIDSVSDPEIADMNVLTVPGVRNTTLTDRVINVCESRADALGIIDVGGGYTPRTENTNSEADRKGTVAATITSVKARNFNSSYGCAYYPWVLVRDELTAANVWMPPSVVALGAMAYAEATAELWFAPAGFNRGGLSLGVGGLPVVGIRDKLTSLNRDDLYEVNINPIASFPSEGIVIFGQKTLQASASALDRINVRRLLIFVKKQVSRYANAILFEQNVKETWDRFKGVVSPFLDSVKNRLGLVEYKLILDETTTTPDLIDRNILYAKIYLKPARAIEYIALDFFITNSGASFEDL